MNLFTLLKKSISVGSFYTMGLALLLIFSPCSVRNSIQSILEVSQTAVSNKSKTTQVSSSTCLEINTIISTLDNPISKCIAFLPPSFFSKRYIFLATFTQEEFFSFSFRNATYLSQIPLYILYRQMKVSLMS